MHVTTLPSPLDSRRAWAMWTIGVLAYVSAVTQRTSFGVAGVYAGERFAAGASVISLFVVVQLLTYAGMQVPVGALADRFGSRLVIATGGVLMFLGQLDLAFSNSVVSAMIARVLVGAGDAMTFTPVVRLLPAWFSPKRLPILTQLVGMLGQAGQLLSAIPFAALLGLTGWTPAFVTASAMALLFGVLVAVTLRDAPPGIRSVAAARQPPLREQLAEILREPGTRVAFWLHWICGFWGMLFAFMWGYPFLTQGEGYSPQVASGLVSLFALAGLPFAPLVGLLSRRAPLQRTNLAVLLAGSAAVPWAAVLLWPGQAPLWLLCLLMVGLAACGPGSSIGFDVARSFVPGSRVGTATGLVITAGFTACLIDIWLVGLALDALGGYSPLNFRLALSTQFLFLAVGLVGLFRARARAREAGRALGVTYLPLHRVLRREWHRWIAQWRTFLTHRPGATTPRPDADLTIGSDDVSVVAVVHGLAGKLLAIDVPPADADEGWWTNRVSDYLALVRDPQARVGAIEVRCASASEARRVSEAIEHALALYGVPLPYEVTTL